MTRIQRLHIHSIIFIIIIIIRAQIWFSHFQTVTSLKPMMPPVCTGGTLTRPKSLTTFPVRLLWSRIPQEDIKARRRIAFMGLRRQPVNAAAFIL